MARYQDLPRSWRQAISYTLVAAAASAVTFGICWGRNARFASRFEVGMRFLTDYIDGDRYFKLTHEQKQKRPKINLERARNQLKLAYEVENNYQQLTTIVNEVLSQLGYRIVLDTEETL